MHIFNTIHTQVAIDGLEIKDRTATTATNKTKRKENDLRQNYKHRLPSGSSLFSSQQLLLPSSDQQTHFERMINI